MVAVKKNKFVEPNSHKDEHWWSNTIDSQSISAWMGNAFELICMSHKQQIKETLHIDTMATFVSTWRCAPDAELGTSGALTE